MTRTILALLACVVLSRAQSTPAAVTATYRFTTPSAAARIEEAATILRTTADVRQASADPADATLTFSGSAEAVNFAEWILPLIDKEAGDKALHEYTLPSGDIGLVAFVPNVPTPMGMNELLTIIRTVDELQRIYNFTPNHAIVLRGSEWTVSFARWIIDQTNQPPTQTPDAAPREFTVGGPDYRGLGHGARANSLVNLTSPQQGNELLTALRTVGDIMKIFNYTPNRVLVLRAGDTDLQRAEWLIQELDRPSGIKTFTAPSGDDVTRIFTVRNSTPAWLQTALSGLRTDLKIQKVYCLSQPADLVVRGTSDQIAGAGAWLVSHGALVE